jgi:beta-lactamase superfamily II metal-dependent hydrolase
VGDAEMVEHEKMSLVTVMSVPHQGILNHTTSDFLLPAYTYVGYRSQHPEEETVEEVKKKVQENNIDGSQLVEFPVDHC